MTSRKPGGGSEPRPRSTRKTGRRPAGPGRGARPARRMSWLTIGLAGTVAAALVALVVVSATRSTSKSAPSGTAPANVATSGGSGRVAPLTLTTIEGRSVSVPGPRPGALFFSVSGCTSCIPSAQALSTLMKTGLGSRVSAVFISMEPQDSPQAMRLLRDTIGDPPYPFAIDTTGTLASQYRIQALGTVVLYDARGRIVDRVVDPSLGQLAEGFRKAGVT
jgi:cytochrome oxidase Cu insertion factor (SCO1/SenC/PrrC family)